MKNSLLTLIFTAFYDNYATFRLGSAFACYQGTSKWDCVPNQQNPHSRTLMFHLDSWRGLLVSSQLREAKPCMTEIKLLRFGFESSKCAATNSQV